MISKQEEGKRGEDYAAYYLEKQGYQIIERNYRSQMGEIDLIAKDQNELVFVEVKTRGQSFYGTPGEAVNHQKKKHIYYVAEYYLMINHLEHVFCRIDVIEIYLHTKTYELNHLKNCILEKPVIRRVKKEKEEIGEEVID